MFSFYYPSRLDFHLANGKTYDDENLRTDTHGLTWGDGYNGQYADIHIDRTPDVAVTSWGACPARAPVHKAVRHRKKRRHRKRAHRHHDPTRPARRPATFTG